MPLVEVVLKLRADDVIRWGDDVAQRADSGQVISKSAKCGDLEHVCLSFGVHWRDRSGPSLQFLVVAIPDRTTALFDALRA
jgi:hypothetical protein